MVLRRRRTTRRRPRTRRPTRRPTRARRRPTRRGKRGGKRYTSNVVFAKNPNPNVFKCMMSYQDYQQKSQAGPFFYHRWMVNSLYDPDSSGIGTKVPQYDTLFARYGRNRVDKAYITLNYKNLSQFPVRVFYILSVNPSQTEFDPQTRDLRADPGFVKYTDLNGVNTPGSMRKVHFKISIVRWLRRLLYPMANPVSINVSSLWTAENSNPSQPLYLYTVVQNWSDDPAFLFVYQYSLDSKYAVTWAALKGDVAAYDSLVGATGTGHDPTSSFDTLGVTGVTGSSFPS